MDLCVIILTSNLEVECKPPKVLPKVCFKVGEKSMIEICLDNIVQLNPAKIILMVSRHHIFYINKILKHSDYFKMISFCITDNTANDPIKNRKISLAKTCYEGKNILVVPANAPLLTTKSLFRLISQNRNVKINNNLFYFKMDHIDKIDSISKYENEKILPTKEIIQIETQTDFELVKNIVEKKR